MFLGLREIATARGRFALIGGVVALITMLVVLLTGLTQGLSRQNTSALESLSATYPEVSFSTDQPSFTESEIHVNEIPAGSIPLGTIQSKLEGVGVVAVLGLPAGTPIPGTKEVVPDSGMVLSESIAEQAPDSKTGVLGGVKLNFSGSVEDQYYSHSPVVWTSTQTWQQVAHTQSGVVGTVLLSTQATDTSVPMHKAFSGLPAYSSERGSLLMMQAFLYGISALVTVAFLSIWTIQRTRELSILRALGATVGYILRDALTQAAIILAAGACLGAAAGWGIGLVVREAVPVAVTPFTTLSPALGIWVLGIVGAVIATRRVAKINPLDALGGQA